MAAWEHLCCGVVLLVFPMLQFGWKGLHLCGALCIFLWLRRKGQQTEASNRLRTSNAGSGNELGNKNAFVFENDLSSMARCGELAVGAVTLLPMRIGLLAAGLFFSWFFALCLTFAPQRNGGNLYRLICRCLLKCSARLLAFSLGVWWVESSGRPAEGKSVV